jgi:hypothetical protein
MAHKKKWTDMVQACMKYQLATVVYNSQRKYNVKLLLLVWGANTSAPYFLCRAAIYDYQD